jgi:hypothetical protein
LNESNEEYIYRICSDKDIIGSWQDVADIINKELGLEYTESKYRKQFQAFEKMFNANKEKFVDNKIIDELIAQKYEIKQERVKFRDERTYVEKLVREIARIDNLKEIALDFATKMNEYFPFINYSIERGTSKRTGILNLSDWHFGLEVDNFINKFNSYVFKERINIIIKETINNINKFDLEKLYVIGLGDYVSGIIHQTIRLENREDIIKQIMIVSETVAEMLYEFSKIIKVEYYDVTDNHSRVHANKKESLSAENFSLLIRWHLQTRFENNENVRINKNEFDDEICTFDIYGFNYLGVHGHKDSVANVVQNMTLLTKRFYDCVFTAHKHHLSGDETHKCYVFSNPCLSGVDAHTKDLRLSSRPAQNLFIVSEDDCIEYVRTIKLD